MINSGKYIEERDNFNKIRNKNSIFFQKIEQNIKLHESKKLTMKKIIIRLNYDKKDEIITKQLDEELLLLP